MGVTHFTKLETWWNYQQSLVVEPLFTTIAGQLGIIDTTSHTTLGIKGCYPLVNLQKAMENHHFSWENPLFLWPFSIAMLVHQRVLDNQFWFWMVLTHTQVSKPSCRGACLKNGILTLDYCSSKAPSVIWCHSQLLCMLGCSKRRTCCCKAGCEQLMMADWNFLESWNHITYTPLGLICIQ